VLRKAILTQEMKPGDVLVERKIAAELGVSKTPVREALISLQQSGLVHSSPTRRLSVAQLTIDDIIHLYETRCLLEGWAVRTANITDDVLREAGELLAQAEAARAAEHPAERALANRKFHGVLFRACPNPLVVRSLESIQDLNALAVTTVLWRQWGNAEAEADEHREIFTALEAGEQSRAADLLDAHMERQLHLAREYRDGAAVA
jgi:DNA-binding GntR family transcriptional regulator